MTTEHDHNKHNTPSSSSEPGSTSFNPVSNDPGGPSDPLKHSGLGIASFILALVAVLGLVIAIIISVAAASEFINLDPSKIESSIVEGSVEELAPFIGAFLLMLGAIGISIIGLILGIIGAVIKTRKKVFSIIGIILNGLIVVGTILLLALGAAVAP